MFGGFLADRFSKRSVTLWTKLAEVFIMLVGTYAAGTLICVWVWPFSS